MMHANVTVIIPCWRCKETITRAVDSVYKQTILPEKVILIDDASGDGTADFLEQLALNYPKEWINVIHLAVNSGPGVARNAGWDMAKTEYIAFLDADDAWHPRKIELQYGWMQSHPDIIITGHESELFDDKFGFPEFQAIESPKEYQLSDMLISNRMITRSVMMKTDITVRFKGKDVTEDYLLWLELSAKKIKIVKFTEALAVSFREEFSIGGYSGNLWKHELRELKALCYLWKTNQLNLFVWLLASAWSLIKYIRRVLINNYRHIHTVATL